eukprot:ctg_4452.g633
MHPGCLQRGHFLGGGAAAATDDGAGVAHAPSGRRRRPRNKRRHRLLYRVLLQIRGRLLLRLSADLADHHNAVGARILQEILQTVDETGAVERVAADADTHRLTQAGARGLRHRLVGERARARHHPDAPGRHDGVRHNAQLVAQRRVQDARTVGPDEPRPRRLGQFSLHPHHILLRYALGDGDDERHARVDGLFDGRRGRGRRHEDDAGVGAGLAHSLGHASKHRAVQVARAGFVGRHTAHDRRAVSDRLLGVERAVLAGEALHDDARVRSHRRRWWTSRGRRRATAERKGAVSRAERAGRGEPSQQPLRCARGSDPRERRRNHTWSSAE